jgi:glutamyl-tRNA synthetase
MTTSPTLPKQIAIYRALGKPIPTFAHVPMILGADGKKLSKRHGATAVGDYRNLGILPLAMRNFLALLGWSPGGDREILPEAEMIKLLLPRRDPEEARGVRSDQARVDERRVPVAGPVEDLLGPVKHHLERSE